MDAHNEAGSRECGVEEAKQPASQTCSESSDLHHPLPPQDTPPYSQDRSSSSSVLEGNEDCFQNDDDYRQHRNDPESPSSLRQTESCPIEEATTSATHKTSPPHGSQATSPTPELGFASSREDVVNEEIEAKAILPEDDAVFLRNGLVVVVEPSDAQPPDQSSISQSTPDATTGEQPTSLSAPNNSSDDLHSSDDLLGACDAHRQTDGGAPSGQESPTSQAFDDQAPPRSDDESRLEARVSEISNEKKTRKSSAARFAIPSPAVRHDHDVHHGFDPDPDPDPLNISSKEESGLLALEQNLDEESLEGETTKRPSFVRIIPKPTSNFALEGALATDPMSTHRQVYGRWTHEEHVRFLHGVKQFGRAWTRVARVVGTRTTVQVRSHAQKFEIKLSKLKESHEKQKREEKEKEQHEGGSRENKESDVIIRHALAHPTHQKVPRRQEVRARNKQARNCSPPPPPLRQVAESSKSKKKKQYQKPAPPPQLHHRLQAADGYLQEGLVSRRPFLGERNPLRGTKRNRPDVFDAESHREALRPGVWPKATFLRQQPAGGLITRVPSPGEKDLRGLETPFAQPHPRFEFMGYEGDRRFPLGPPSGPPAVLRGASPRPLVRMIPGVGGRPGVTSDRPGSPFYRLHQQQEMQQPWETSSDAARAAYVQRRGPRPEIGFPLHPPFHPEFVKEADPRYEPYARSRFEASPVYSRETADMWVRGRPSHQQEALEEAVQLRHVHQQQQKVRANNEDSEARQRQADIFNQFHRPPVLPHAHSRIPRGFSYAEFAEEEFEQAAMRAHEQQEEEEEKRRLQETGTFRHPFERARFVRGFHPQPMPVEFVDDAGMYFADRGGRYGQEPYPSSYETALPHAQRRTAIADTRALREAYDTQGRSTPDLEIEPIELQRSSRLGKLAFEARIMRQKERGLDDGLEQGATLVQRSNSSRARAFRRPHHGGSVVGEL